MEFLHPGFLLGLGSLGLPLFFHLLRRNQTRRVPYPTLRFFRLLQKRSSFLFRVGHLLLLLLRLALLAAITVLFAQPFFTAASLRHLNSGPRLVVLLFDNSASTGASLPGAGEAPDPGDGAPATTRDALLAALPARLAPKDARDRLEVYALAPAARRVYAGPLGDFRLEDLPPLTGAGADWAGGFQAVDRALARGDRPEREVILASDFQAGDLRGGARPPAWKAGLHLVRPPEPPRVNAGVVEVREDAAAAVVGRPFSVRATVVQRGGRGEPAGEPRRLRLVRRRDGREETLAEAEVPDQARASLTLAATFYEPGPADLELRLAGGPDSWPGDDRVPLRVEVGEPRAILAWNGDPRPARLYDELFYLTKAAEAAGLRVDTISSAAELEFRDPAGYAAMHFANVRDPAGSEDFLAALLEAQGAAVFWLGDKTDPGAWRRGPLGRYVAAELYGRARQAGGAPWSYRGPSRRVPALAGLGDAKYWGGIASRGYWFLRPDDGFDPRGVLARQEDGTPAVLAVPAGRGAAVLVNAGADLEDSDLPMHPVYPALIRRTTLLADRPLPTYQAGEVVRFPVREERQAEKLVVLTPDARRIPLRPQLQGEALVGLLEDTRVPGIYRLEEGAGAGALRRFFQVRGDPGESVFEPLDPAALREVFPPEPARRARTGGPRLRDILLLALCLLLLGESYLVGYLETTPGGPGPP